MLMQAKVLSIAETAPKVVTYVNRYIITTNTTTYTFSSCDLGLPSPDRRVIVGAHQYGSTSRSLSSATINGVSATILTTNTAGTPMTVLIIATVTSGATGNIVLTWSGSCAGSAVSVWYATGLTSDTPIATQRSTSTTAPNSTSLATTNGGFIIGATTARNPTLLTHSWTNATEQFDVELENAGGDGASISGAHATTTGSNITVTDTFSGTATNGVGAFATF